MLGIDRILFRRGSSSAWTASNRILSSGEPGYDQTTGDLKIGNGSTPWPALDSYAKKGSTAGVQALETASNAQWLEYQSSTNNFRLRSALFVDPCDIRFGAKGDGIADDTSSFQAAATYAAANNLAFRPPSGKAFKLTDTITFRPASGQAFFESVIDFDSHFLNIIWAGGSNKSVFHIVNHKHGQISGIRVTINSGQNNVTVFDEDHDLSFGGGSNGQKEYRDCLVRSSDSTATGLRGWRVGRSIGVESSFISWHSCHVDFSGLANSRDNRGWLIADPNGLVWNFHNCFTFNANVAWSNSYTSDNDFPYSQDGGGEWFFYGCGATGNQLDFDFNRGASYAIFGGRFESGTSFAKLSGLATGAKFTTQFTISGVTVDAYSGRTDSGYVGTILSLNAAASLVLSGSRFTRSVAGSLTTFDSNFIKVSCDSVNGYGSLNVFGNSIMGTDPFWTISQGNWDTTGIHGNILTTASGTPESIGFATPGKARVNGLMTKDTFQSVTNATTDLVIKSIKNGESVDRFQVKGSGEYHIGSGSTPPDVYFGRYIAGHLLILGEGAATETALRVRGLAGQTSPALFTEDVNGVEGVAMTPDGLARTKRLRVSSPSVPSSATAPGATGDIAWDSSYVYVCVASNSWKRTSITSW